MEIFHTINIMLHLGMGVGRGGEGYWLFWFSGSLNFSKRVFGNFVKFVKIWGFYDLCPGTGCKLVVVW